MFPFYTPWKYRKATFTWTGLMVDNFVLINIKVSYSDQTNAAPNGYWNINYYRFLRKFPSTIQKEYRILSSAF